MLSNFGLVGVAGHFFSSFFFGLFGLLEYVFPILLFLGGAFYLANRRSPLLRRKMIGAAGLFCMSCVLIHLLTAGYSETVRISSLFSRSAGDRFGGGLLGGALTQLLCRIFGTAGTYVIVLALLAVFAIITTRSRSLPKPGKKALRRISRPESIMRRRKNAEKNGARSRSWRRFQKQRVHAAGISGFLYPKKRYKLWGRGSTGIGRAPSFRGDPSAA